MTSLASCIFCKIVKGEIPSFKLLETETVFAFMDIGPISKGHCLVIPKYHAKTLTELPDDQLVDILPAVKKLAAATGAENYNILQNNGRPAHQEVDHVHFHIIPKPTEAGDKEGLVIGWPTQKQASPVDNPPSPPSPIPGGTAGTKLGKDDIAKTFEEIKSRL